MPPKKRKPEEEKKRGPIFIRTARAEKGKKKEELYAL